MPPKSRPVADRFWEKVNFPDPPGGDDCWEWTAERLAEFDNWGERTPPMPPKGAPEGE